ncbi:MAG: hypothetical protein M1833_001064 [Piccolia ochrophora]|nr:MAG: hypothetical protein M1833_001064 [Piccolia ochrophora]
MGTTGLKAADQILRKNPNHGDTLAMKALILNSQGHAEEAFALAKVALKNDMKSHVCWHVYGLLYRSEKNFEEAIKAYKFALKLEPDSQQIQRDLALLQIQMRDYQGYIGSRRSMLQARSGLRQNWTALAIARHLAGDLAGAESVLATYEGTLKNPPPKTDLEHSEAVLYKNSIIAERGEFERALEHLETVSKTNLDRTAVMEMRAAYLQKLDRKDEAENAYRALLDRNPENRSYYEGLGWSLGLGESDENSVLRVYEEIAEKNARGDAPRRIPLSILQGDKFRQVADSYLRRMLVKGVPSTFANVKALYSDTTKRDTVRELVEGYVSGKAEHMTNGSSDDQADGETPRLEKSALFFLAQHYNYYLSRDLKKAMDYIDNAIELSPDSVDYHMTKARIWKHSGNLQKASETMEHARTLDERDRYINSKAAKYQLRNHENEKAIQTMSKFTRNEGSNGGPLGDLHDMQCVWYITEDGESYLRQGNFGLALKRFNSIYDVFEVWQEDQFDFHSFSLRKGQIRAYIDMVRWEDRLREHPFFSRAAIAAITAYLKLYDNPSLADGPPMNGRNGVGDRNGLDATEQKKAAKKARRDQQKQEKVESAKKDEKKTSGTGTSASVEPKKEDKDPSGLKLAQTSEPLKDALKYLIPLLELSPKSINAQIVGFEVYIRRKKYLLALRCLLAASRLDATNPTLHEQTIRFKQALSELPTPLPEKPSSIIASLFTLIPTDQSLSEFNDAFHAAHRNSPPHLLAALRTRHRLDPSSIADNEKALLEMLAAAEIQLDDAVEGARVLEEWGSKEGVREEYRKKARGRWPEASAFAEKKA